MTDQTTTDDLLYFNGINGATGEYGLSPMMADAFANIIADQEDPENLNDLIKKHQDSTEAHLGVKEGLDPTNLAETGWGVIFADTADPVLQEALKLLLDLRREQAGPYFKIFSGAGGYRNSDDPARRDTKQRFLTRYKVGPGPVDPSLGVPYYLLIVGGPEEIPYEFQYQLDVQFAVGRIHFDALRDYEQYARSVVAVERGEVKLPRRLSFFGVENPHDRTTQLSSNNLVHPLIEHLTAKIEKPDQGTLKGWQINSFLRQEATKANLARLLGGDQTPALLFTASHGMEFPKGHERQVSDQGALLCQDWPGPREWRKPVPPEFYFAGRDVDEAGRLLGLITFHFACYGVATPKFDEFFQLANLAERQVITEEAFITDLPKKLLSHPQGGALAVIGHMERAWGYSFSATGVKSNTEAFESMLTGLMNGLPVGAAAEFLDERYAELATELTKSLEEVDAGKQIPPRELSSLWTAHNDARDYIIIGDPAVRLPVVAPNQEADQAETPFERPIVERESKAEQPLGLPPLADLVAFIQDEPPEDEYLPELKIIANNKQTGTDSPHTFDDKNLAEAGWGIVFAPDVPPTLKESLQPLLDLRQKQAGDRFRVLDYGVKASKNKRNLFLAQSGVTVSQTGNTVNPAELPYYLLLVGSPAEIPYDIQQQLGLLYAVGRIHFDTLEEYEQYARSIVAVETGQVKLPRQASIFSVTHPDDQTTERRTQYLIDPLVEKLKQIPGWQVNTFLREQATKTQLQHLLGGEETPALLVANGYGAIFPKVDPLQGYQQGALLCQDWSGPNSSIPITQKYYFAGDDLSPEGNVLGLLTFLVADYGAGTFIDDRFAEPRAKQNGRTRPGQPFTAGLPKALLSHRQGGALAVVSYLGPIWDHLFLWSEIAEQSNIFIQVIERVLNRYPIGAAVQYFSGRYAELAAKLARMIDYDLIENRPDEAVGLWGASHDLGHCVIIGDPATRLPVVEPDASPEERPVVEIATTKTLSQAVIAKPQHDSRDADQQDTPPLPSINKADWQNTPSEIKKILTAYIKRYGPL